MKPTQRHLLYSENALLQSLKTIQYNTMHYTTVQCNTTPYDPIQ